MSKFGQRTASFRPCERWVPVRRGACGKKGRYIIYGTRTLCKECYQRFRAGRETLFEAGRAPSAAERWAFMEKIRMSLPVLAMVLCVLMMACEGPYGSYVPPPPADGAPNPLSCVASRLQLYECTCLCTKSTCYKEKIGDTFVLSDRIEENSVCLGKAMKSSITSVRSDGCTAQCNTEGLYVGPYVYDMNINCVVMCPSGSNCGYSISCNCR